MNCPECTLEVIGWHCPCGWQREAKPKREKMIQRCLTPDCKMFVRYEVGDTEEFQRCRACRMKDKQEATAALDAIAAQQGCPLSPALMGAIKAFAARHQARACYAQSKKREDPRQMQRWSKDNERLTQELIRHMQALQEGELGEFMDRYGDQVTSAMEA